MHLDRTRNVKTLFSAVIVASALAIPAAVPATAAPSSTAQAAADSIDATCKKKNSKYIVKKYHRGPGVYTLRCGTKTWGWKHIKLRHGWNNTMDKRIRAAIWSGKPNGRGGYSTYAPACPPKEKFRTIIGTPAGTNDLLTAYTVTKGYAAKC